MRRGVPVALLPLALLVVGLGVPTAGCGGGSGRLVPPREDGGTGGTGEAGQGGAPASGGTPGTGGAPGQDGAAGTGGAPASGGGAGTGGASTGGAGAGGADCGAVPAPTEGKVCTEIFIDSAAALTAAMQCLEVTGSVNISPSFVGTVELPRLRKVGGDVRRENAKAPTDANDPLMTTRVRLPNVKQVGGDVWFYLDQNLVELDLRSVETITGRAWVYRDTLIRTLRLDGLKQVGMDFYIADVFQLPDCVAKDIGSHVTAGQSVMAIGAKVPTNCHCEAVCGHVEQRCP